MSNFVDRRSNKSEMYLKRLAKRLTGDDTVGQTQPDGVIYLGGGFWRCIESDDGKGYHLINPDLTPEEISIIASAINILI